VISGSVVNFIGTAVPFSAFALGSNACGILNAPTIQGNGTKLQAAGTVSGSAGVTFCTDAGGNTTTTGCTGGGSSFVDYVAPRNAITSNGTDQAAFTYAAPALPAGACYSIKFAFYSATAIGSIKIKVDGTLIATPFGNPGLTGLSEEVDYCNNAGVQNAQSFYYASQMFYGGNVYASGTENSPSDTDARLSTPSAFNWSSGHTITITCNTSSGTSIMTGAVLHAH